LYNGYLKKVEDLRISNYNNMDSAYDLARHRAWREVKKACRSPIIKKEKKPNIKNCEKSFEDLLKFKHKLTEKLYAMPPEDREMGKCLRILNEGKASAPAAPKECEGLKVKDLSTQTSDMLNPGINVDNESKKSRTDENVSDLYQSTQKTL